VTVPRSTVMVALVLKFVLDLKPMIHCGSVSVIIVGIIVD